MEQQHCIKKQLIEIRVRDKRSINAMQEKISTLYHSHIVPYIEECCSALSRPGIIHKIDRLEMNIGTINPHYLTTEFEEKLKPVLYEQLAEKITTASQGFSVEQAGMIEKTATVPETFSAEQPKTAEKSNPPATQKGTGSEMLAHFMQTGLLPWWAEKHNKHALEKILEKLINGAPEEAKNLLQTIMNNPVYLKRFILHFSDEILFKAARLIAPRFFPFLKNYGQDLQQITGLGVFKNIPKVRFRFEQFKSLFISILYSDFITFREETLVEHHLIRLAKNLNTDYTVMIRDITQHIAQEQKNNRPFKSALPRIVTEIHMRTTKKATGAKPEKKPQKIPVRTRMQNSQINDLKAQLQQLHQQEYSEKAQEQIQKLQQEIQQLKAAENPFETLNNPFNHSDEIYIDNAGLVLLWPFLPRFFETIGLVKEKMFTDETGKETSKNNNPGGYRERAAMLLQYLSDGSEISAEHLLPLNKILCGIDLLQPIHTEIRLSELEKEESQNLLTAVAANNPMWKNLSAQGLRNAYLQREGVLSIKDGGWWLHVEKKTHDITLDQLPWTIGVIKLPWMENIIYTEW